MQKLLSQFNLGDSYEIQARVLPAMIVVVPLAALLLQVEWRDQHWLGLLAWGAGLEIVMAILFSKVGHALGAKLQKRLEGEWNGLPTHAWLRPGDTTHSQQQKQAWRQAVSTLSGLDLDKAFGEADAAEIDRVIADAVASCRNKLRNHPKAELLLKHNMAFGFCRNLAGLRWVALGICIACSAAAFYGAARCGLPRGGAVVQAIFLLLATCNAWLAIGYVSHCAIRYAEFFFATVSEVTSSKDDTHGV